MPPVAPWLSAAIDAYYSGNNPTYGTPKCVVLGIAQGESDSSASAGVNPQGYGGRFGLAQGSGYDTAAGHISTPNLLDDSTIAQQILIVVALYAKDGIGPWSGDQSIVSSACGGSVPGASGQTGSAPATLTAASAPSPGTPAGGNTAVPGGCSSNCVIGFPGVIFGAGSFCILNGCQMKALRSALIVGAGAVGMLLALGLLAAFGLERTAPGRAVAGMLGGTPSAGKRAAGKVTGGAKGAAATPAPATARQPIARSSGSKAPQTPDQLIAKNRRGAMDLDDAEYKAYQRQLRAQGRTPQGEAARNRAARRRYAGSQPRPRRRQPQRSNPRRDLRV